MRQGIDSGYFYTKSSAGMKYKSGLIESVSDPIGADHRILFDSRYYSIGERRNAMELDKTADNNMLIQMLPALGYAIESRKMERRQELELGVGTPLKQYGQEWEKYREYFLGKDLDFLYNGKEYSIKINRVEVYPQGYAAYLAHYAEYGKYPELNVVDIGGGTVDAFRISGGMPVTSTFVSIRFGVITLVNSIRDELEPERIFISESQICNAVMEQENLHLKADHIDMVARIQRNEYIKSLIYQLQERGFDFSVPTLFIGGGTMLLMKFWKKYNINMVGCLDEMANAKAYEALLDRKG